MCKWTEENTSVCLPVALSHSLMIWCVQTKRCTDLCHSSQGNQASQTHVRYIKGGILQDKYWTSLCSVGSPKQIIIL